jgi:hypothetical protein
MNCLRLHHRDENAHRVKVIRENADMAMNAQKSQLLRSGSSRDGSDPPKQAAFNPPSVRSPGAASRLHACVAQALSVHIFDRLAFSGDSLETAGRIIRQPDCRYHSTYFSV